MKKLLCILSCVAILAACKEEVDTSARYVFKQNTALSYLQKYSNVYSEYIHLLAQTPVSKMSTTTMYQLLSARGHYTLFAPTNKAIDDYLNSLVEEGIINSPSWDAFTDSTKLDSIRKVIVYNSVIDSGDDLQPYDVARFPTKNGGELVTPNMYDHKLTFYYRGSTDSIYVNDKCRIHPINRDIYVLNGIIHQMETVIAPKDVTAAMYLQDLIERDEETYLVMAKAIRACGLMDTLKAIRDEAYEEAYQRGDIPDLSGMTTMGVDFSNAWAPKHRKYGFTIFAETDDFWRKQGLDPHDPDLLPKLVQWLVNQHQYADTDKFVTDENYKSEENLLYQWVTYHILPIKLPVGKLVTHFNEVGYTTSMPSSYSIAIYELYTTIGKRRLLKVFESKESQGIYLNRFPNLDNGRKGTYHELSCDPDKVGCRVGTDDDRNVLSDMINCNIYPIDAPLSYNDDVRNNLMKQRLRFDAQSIFPETMNNDMRQNENGDNRNVFVYIPQDKVYHYLDNMWLTDDTYMVCINYRGGNPSMNADEMKAGGRYDVTIKLPPVPRSGTYEFRFAILNRSYRGVCQIYLGTDRQNRTVTGIPTDMTKDLWAFASGYEKETDDMEYNAEVDKRMRSLGYMKGCMSYAPSGNAAEAMRINGTYSCMRQLVIRKHIDPEKDYYVSFKNVLDNFKELYLDYFEWAAKEVYDNPETPEDIW